MTGMWVRAAVRMAVIAAVCAGGAQASFAQNVKMYKEGETPSANEIADILSHSARDAIKTRGLNGGGQPFALLQQMETERAADANAFALPIAFEFDSAVLTAGARRQLDTVAEGVRLTEGTVHVVVEGHTDAKGPVGYNEALSLRRAEAVRKYLVDVKRLDASLFRIEGKGPHQLIDKNDPFSPRNRRVQFRAG